jgi:hypothetical protein
LLKSEEYEELEPEELSALIQDKFERFMKNDYPKILDVILKLQI